MNKLLVSLLACTLCGAAQARSLVIQENARLTSPDPSYPEFGTGVAIDGDDALVVLRRYTPPNDELGQDEIEDIAVWLFRRVNGTWTPVRQLESTRHGLEYIWGGDVAMQNGIAALAINPLSIYERRNGDWVQVLDGVMADEPGTSIEVDHGRVIFGGSSGTFMGTVFARNASGQWQQEARLLGSERGGDIENSGGQVGLSGTHAVVHSRSSDDLTVPAPNVRAFRFTPEFGWQQEGSPIIDEYPQGPLGREVAVRGDDVFISGRAASGTFVFRRLPPGQCCDWYPQDWLQPLDGYPGGGEASIIKKNSAFLMQNGWSADRQAIVINVFALNNDTGLYRQVAVLTASGGESLGNFNLSGRRVMARCGEEVCYFELPGSLALPARIQEVFPGTTPNGWTLSSGSRFIITSNGVSNVLRQTEIQSGATHTATLDASNWTNQSIQADIRPTAFNGNSWFGLATRWRNASNYYYVTVRNSGVVSLRRNVNGTFRELAAAPLPVILARTYKVRLESIGTRHRVYVNGEPLLDVDDSSIASGRAALLTLRTAAEFDNVVASPTPTVTMFSFDPRQPFQPQPGTFTESGTGLWFYQGDTGGNFISQASVFGDARAVIGVTTDDQSIDIRARATTFAGSGSNVRWFGVMARYVDQSNYIYLSVRSDNSVSLRKVNNGTITILGTKSMAVNLRQWYRLRLEAVGSRVRAYVNNRPVLEAVDATLPRGITGAVTYRAAADFADYRAIQP
jgi:hypothetical protein